MAATGKGRTVADQVYHQLREDIFNGRLPAGSKLKLERLMADYKVTMSPLREALVRLCGDSLVTAEGYRGFWVAPISVDELEDVCRVRALLEVEALNLALQHGGAKWKAAVRKAYEALSAVERSMSKDEDPPPEMIAEWERCNRAFHVALVSGCGSPWLIQLNERLYRQTERYRRLSLAGHRHHSVHDEHEAIFEAAMQSDAVRLFRLTREHLERRTASEVRHALETMDAGEPAKDIAA